MFNMCTACLVALSALVVLSPSALAASDFLIGRGIYDVTGPAAEVNLMGYAYIQQTAAGIHFRIRSRAFIFEDPATNKRLVFVSVDSGMASQIMKMKVVEKLQTLYGSLYTTSNVAISGTHTHSTPAGMLQYTLFQITSLGQVKQSLDAFVDGIVQSIVIAHNNVQAGSVYINVGEVPDANINRSPTAYANNPAWERAMYAHNTDHNMTLLKLVSSGGEELGMLNWHAVHGTSMNNTNRLISGDNKGYAAMKFEEAKNGGTGPGMGPFVASFAQSNLGDVSPNTRGPYCYKGPHAGEPCDRLTSTCGGKNEYCIGRGPGENMFESAKIIGQRQLDVAMNLYNEASTRLQGSVDYVSMFIDMTNQTVVHNGTTAKTCKTSMGYAFAAGTTDGPGMFNFHQATTHGNAFWDIARDLIATPSPELIACQYPKPILLATGELTAPYAWDPEIVEVQLLKVGQLFIVVVPGEFTTMAGRRTRRAVMETLQQQGIADGNSHIVIAGLANTYASYVTTFEEYQVQRYEGASTIYGPHELQAYINSFNTLATHMAASTTPPAGPSPPDLSSQQLEFLPPVIFDGVPIGKHFGEESAAPEPSYPAGCTVSATFYTGNPRNDLRTQGTFLTVDRQLPNGTWEVVLNDGAWDTKFHWYRHSILTDVSYAECIWDIAADTAPGTYRITHYGTSKFFNKKTPFTGVSSTFTVTAPSASPCPVPSTPIRDEGKCGRSCAMWIVAAVLGVVAVFAMAIAIHEGAICGKPKQGRAGRK